MKKLSPSLAFTALYIGLLLVFVSCGDINQGQLSYGQSRISSLALDWPDGYQYEPAKARLYGPGVYDTAAIRRATPSYVTSITVTITGGGASKVYNVSLETAEIDDFFQPGQYTISVVVKTSIGLTFTGSTTVVIVSGSNDDIAINLKVDAPPTSESISVSDSKPNKNESVTITISVTDLDAGDVFSYSWSASGGSLSGSGNSATWSSDKSGSYSVTVTVDDGRGGVMSKSASITVVNRNPVISSVSVDDASPAVGDTVTATCSASDPDDDQLTYSWSNGASGTTSQHTVTSNNSFTMKCTVADGDGGTASKSVTINGVVTIPSAPTGVSASGGNSKVTVSWSSVTDATSYNIYWDTSPSVTTASTKITGASSSYAHTGRTNGTAYYYVVTAVNSAGESSASNEVNANAGILIAGLFTDSKLQTCVDAMATTNGWTYASEVTSITSCDNKLIVGLSGMEYLTNITVLSLSGNNIVNLSPLAGLTNLLRLYLHVNSITDVSPLASLTNLTMLTLQVNNITSVSGLTNLTALTILSLQVNSITDVGPLNSLVGLTTLYLQSNGITTGVGNLGTLTNMNTLLIGSNTGMPCSDLDTLICGTGNTVVGTSAPYSCSPASTGLGTAVDLVGDGIGQIDLPISGTNCT